LIGTFKRLIEGLVSLSFEGLFETIMFFYAHNRGRKLLDRLHTKASKRVYRLMHCFCPTLASLLSPLFVHFRVPRVTSYSLFIDARVKRLMAYDYNRD
jgi:hypothetical protein